MYRGKGHPIALTFWNWFSFALLYWNKRPVLYSAGLKFRHSGEFKGRETGENFLISSNDFGIQLWGILGQTIDPAGTTPHHRQLVLKYTPRFSMTRPEAVHGNIKSVLQQFRGDRYAHTCQASVSQRPSSTLLDERLYSSVDRERHVRSQKGPISRKGRSKWPFVKRMPRATMPEEPPKEMVYSVGGAAFLPVQPSRWITRRRAVIQVSNTIARRGFQIWLLERNLRA